ncbi:hypothetical protein OROHE_012441 [Orobanche hederae]
MTSDNGKFYILVDNRPWLKDLVSRPTHLWQLMVTKSRLSPFANTRGRKDRKIIKELSELQVSSSSNSRSFRDFKNWFPLMDAVLLSRKRTLLPVKKLRNSLIANSKLHRTLYGFIVFEVAWRDVRGINYLNELQNDTSLAMEAKVMRRWEFDSITQAARSISSWFLGTLHEQIFLEEHLDDILGQNLKSPFPENLEAYLEPIFSQYSAYRQCKTVILIFDGMFKNHIHTISKFEIFTGEKEVFHDAQESFQGPNEADNDDVINNDTGARDQSSSSLHSCFDVYPVTIGNRRNRSLTPPPVDVPYKRRKVMTPIYCDLGISSGQEDTASVDMLPQTPNPSDCEEILHPTLYRDVLILLRFDDRDLPFKLKDIIISDLRLLTLLEAGLPSWVIFLQSYPVFCHIYRPWMCPLARALYVLISSVTVLIGFYDLYKNVPLLKATASSLFGPLFDWIEKLEMISRIKYLGTMLFLHNFQKAIKWFLLVTRTTRSCLSFVIEPVSGPFAEFVEFFIPVCRIFIQLAESFFSVTWMMVESCFTIVGDLVEILLLPFWYVLVVIWNVATSVIYPVFWILWEILYAPIRLVLGFCSLVVYFCTFVYNLVGDLWLFGSSIFNFTREVESTVNSYEVSMWRSLWNDLFSQVFRALRSILNGFVAFFAACNRHRLSIYNHVKEIYNRFLCATRRRGPGRHIQVGQYPDAQISPRGGKVIHRHEVISKKTR